MKIQALKSNDHKKLPSFGFGFLFTLIFISLLSSPVTAQSKPGYPFYVGAGTTLGDASIYHARGMILWNDPPAIPTLPGMRLYEIGYGVTSFTNFDDIAFALSFLGRSGIFTTVYNEGRKMKFPLFISGGMGLLIHPSFQFFVELGIGLEFQLSKSGPVLVLGVAALIADEGSSAPLTIGIKF